MSLIPAFSIFDFFGVGVAAVSGVLVAGRRRMDLFGVFVVAIVTAVGGGTIRDVLLDRHPIFWIAHPVYLLVIAICSAGTVIYTWVSLPRERLLLIADAFALGLFTIAGVQIAEQLYVPRTIAVVMGTLTGIGGGILRDVLTRELPLVLQRDIYATAAILGASLYVLLRYFRVDMDVSAVIGMTAIFAIRIVVIIRRVDLPIFSIDDTHARLRQTREWEASQSSTPPED